jgi:hypothetical protein
MKTLLITLLLAAPAFAWQGFDFKSLDKLDALTNNKTKVTLDADMLKLLTMFLGGDDNKSDQHPDSLQAMVAGLKGVYVRTWEFDKDGQYSPSDVEPFRAYLKQQQWVRIVESQEGRELSEVYILPGPGGKFGGVAIVDIEPRELTVVYINGTISMSDLQKLQGNLGIPGVNLHHTPDKKKDDDNDLGVNDLGVNDLGVNDLGVNDLGVNDLGVNDLGVNDLGVNDLGVN